MTADQPARDTHRDALARAMHDAEHPRGCDCDTKGIGGPWSEDAAAVLDSTDPDVHAALLDALVRHGVLTLRVNRGDDGLYRYQTEWREVEP